MDAALTTRLQDPNSRSEVLLYLEHKSKPSRTVALQLLTEAVWSLHHHWVSNDRPESGNYTPPIPLMVIVYNGNEGWNGAIWFQDLYPDLPEDVRQFVPQFQVIFINLRRFQYGNLPGKPVTQAVVESLMRATDGTLIDHLPSVFQHVADSDLNEKERMDLTLTLSTYSTWTAKATPQQISKALSTVFQEQEYLKMIEEINNSFILEGFELGKIKGELKGELKGRIRDIQKLLEIRFHKIPGVIADKLNGRTDLVTLDSLFDLAAQCKTLDEFTNALK